MSYGLNLLPPDEKATVALESARHQWVTVFASLAGTLVVLIAGIMFLTNQLDQRLTTLTNDEATLQRQASGSGTIDLTRDTNRVNDQIELLQKVLGTDRDWSTIVRTILTEIPSNVTLTSLKIKMNGAVTLTGTAESRASFLTLQSAMTASQVLQNARTADTPSKREDLPFTYSAILATKP